MTARLRGFATLTALALLTLLVVYLAGATSSVSQLQRDWERAAPLQEAQIRAWKTLDTALALMAEGWDPDQERFSTWAANHPLPSVRWEVLSGRVNLNTVSPFVLALGGFQSTLQGGSVEHFVSARSSLGPVSEISGYADLIAPEALASWYTVHGRWNLNTADEVMLEKMVSIRTGTPAVGSALRSTVRSFRERQVAMTSGDWERVAGSAREVLDPLVTIAPELDVNEAPEALLISLVANPAWQVEEPLAKVATIVGGRALTPWTDLALKELLRVPESSVLLSYLGTRTTFLSVSYQSKEGTLTWTLFLERDSKVGRVTPRIVESHWSLR